MKKLASLFLVMSLAFASPVAAQDNSDAAKEALAICMKSFPDLSGVKKALSAEGWDFRGGGNNGLYIYVRDGLRGVVAHTMVNAPDKGCFVTASKMSTDFALAMAAAVVKQMKDVEELGSDHNFANRWIGTLNGRPIDLGVLKKFDLGFMRGAAVAFIEL